MLCHATNLSKYAVVYLSAFPWVSFHEKETTILIKINLHLTSLVYVLVHPRYSYNFMRFSVPQITYKDFNHFPETRFLNIVGQTTYILGYIPFGK